MDAFEHDTKILAFRLPVKRADELLSRKLSDENQSDLLRRVVDKFLKSPKKRTSGSD
jgi:hypothetical protein